MPPKISYLVMLGADLTTAEQIQEIAGLASPPALKPAEKAHEDDYDEGDDEDDSGEHYNASSSPESNDLHEAQYDDREDHYDASTLPDSNDLYDDLRRAQCSEPPPRPEKLQRCCVVDAATRDNLAQWGKKEDKKISLCNFPVPYFFYGTPSDPKFLAKKLELAEHPDMPKASITGWRLKMWEEYKALVDCEALNTICWWRVKHTGCRMKSSLETWLLGKAKIIRCRDVRYSVKGKGKGNREQGF
ncbi:hypothetical protein OEA41_001930 [Lepraria neglecta]|uniref:Uncharacterized protein n=1 Tax=Lepraria neglecta TaxID=209136 RepID=A0AAD9ZAZ1_9LECA|nr:hypothetical protein OEA41_001930 [Lepraria neglecta]